MYFEKVLAMIASSMLTRNCHSLPPTPDISRIFGLLHASVTWGTCSSLMMGMAPRQAPLCVWPMITSTLSTSTSLRTALTASPGVPLLSAKKASTLCPMMPPLRVDVLHGHGGAPHHAFARDGRGPAHGRREADADRLGRGRSRGQQHHHQRHDGLHVSSPGPRVDGRFKLDQVLAHAKAGSPDDGQILAPSASAAACPSP